MGRKYATRDQEALHFVTFTVVNWIDLFTRNIYREIIMDSLRYCQLNKGLKVHAYCIMTNHIHLILSVVRGAVLSDVIRDFKSFTSYRLRKDIKMNGRESRRKWLLAMIESAGLKNPPNRDFQLWQQHNHPIELSSNRMMYQRLDYIHNNPVKAGFVNNPAAWSWSSCTSYEMGLSSGLEIVVYLIDAQCVDPKIRSASPRS